MIFSLKNSKLPKIYNPFLNDILKYTINSLAKKNR